MKRVSVNSELREKAWANDIQPNIGPVAGWDLVYRLLLFPDWIFRQKQRPINQPANCHAAKQAPATSSQPGQKRMRNMAFPQPKMKTANS